MPGKSRHGMGRGSLQSKKRRNVRRSHQVAVARPQAVARSDEPTVVSHEVKAPLSSMAAKVPVRINYPNLPYELRRIGILAGAILAILILLALLLS